MKETLNDHRYVKLSDIFKEKECIEARIGDFNIDSVLDVETQVKIMPKITWEAIGKLEMTPSLGGIRLFRGKLMMLCGKLAQIPMTVNGTSTKEDFEIIKFIKDNAPFTTLLAAQRIADLEIRTVPETPQEIRDLREATARSAVSIMKSLSLECKQLSSRSAQTYDSLTENPELQALES
jgi:hypothetical protein